MPNHRHSQASSHRSAICAPRSAPIAAASGLVLLGALVAAAAHAVVDGGLSSSGYSIDWHTIDGGGGASAGGGFLLTGTSGQPDAGTMAGGGFTLVGGFWAGAGSVEPKAPPCPADLTGDGVVDGADLGVLLNAWGSASPLADLNTDGIVDGADLGLLLNAWGPCAE